MLNIKRRPTAAFDSGTQQIHPIIQRLYSGRGLSHIDEMKTASKELLPFTLLKDIDKAAERLVLAAQQQQKVMIVGDFDADGATSTALMMLGLRKLGLHNVDFRVPNRFEYGYGLSPELVRDIIPFNVDLIVTVDNGISCIAGVELANQANIDVIVTDHHLPGNETPKAVAIVNPNQHGCSFPSKSTAGVGVAFYVLMALRAALRDINWFEQQSIAQPNLAELLDIVALGTVADVVQLDTNNRILVYQGLARIKQGVCRPGIRALLHLANKDLSQVKASDFGFVLGPRLNAAGRLDDMSFGIRCLLTEDYGQALKMAEDLTSLNNERKEIEAGMRQEAEAAVNTMSILSGEIPNGIVVYEPNWHQGVIGIVAGRIKEKYYRPTVAFALGENEAELKGSARSIPGIHIRDVLDEINTQFPNIILKFGGHAMAAGLTINTSKLDEFKQALDHVLSKHLSEQVLTQITYTDGELDSEYLNVDFCRLLNNAGPWGQGFDEPCFDGEFEIMSQRLVGAKHLKLVLANEDGLVIDGIQFNADLKHWPNESARRVQIVYQLDINEFRNKTNLQFLIRDIAAI